MQLLKMPLKILNINFEMTIVQYEHVSLMFKQTFIIKISRARDQKVDSPSSLRGANHIVSCEIITQQDANPSR